MSLPFPDQVWKRQFRSLFRTICPRFTEHRWEFLFETLDWVMTHKAALMLVQMEDHMGEPTEETSSNPNIRDLLTAREIQLLGCLSTSAQESTESALFWATASLTELLAQWGHWFSSSIHHCPCHRIEGKPKIGKKQLKKQTQTQNQKKAMTQGNQVVAGGDHVLTVAATEIDDSPGQCPMIGRTAVLLASGLPDFAIARLQSVQIPQQARQSLDVLSTVDPAQAQVLMNEFHFAVSRLVFRTKQNFSYWKELPWALLMLMRPFVEQFTSSSEAAAGSFFLIFCK